MSVYLKRRSVCQQIDEDMTARISMADVKFSFQCPGRMYSPAWVAPEGRHHSYSQIQSGSWSHSRSIVNDGCTELYMVAEINVSCRFSPCATLKTENVETYLDYRM